MEWSLGLFAHAENGPDFSQFMLHAGQIGERVAWPERPIPATFALGHTMQTAIPVSRPTIIPCALLLLALILVGALAGFLCFSMHGRSPG